MLQNKTSDDEKTDRVLPLRELRRRCGQKESKGNLYLLLILWNVKASPGGNTLKLELILY